MKFLHPVLAALCIGSFVLASTAARADHHDEDRVSLGIAVTERDGRLVVAHVIKDLPADEAGLKRGDEIRKVDGEQVRNAREFLAKLEDKEEGDQIELEISRDGDAKTMDIELASYRDMREAAREDDEYRRRVGQAGQMRGQDQQMRGQDQRMRGQDQQFASRELQQLRQQVQDLQRQVRQMQSQLQQRDGGGQQFGQQRGGQQFGQPQYGQPQYGQPQYGQPQYGQAWDDRQQYGGQQFSQQRDDRQQRGGQFGQQWDDRSYDQQREAGRQQQQQQYRRTPFR